MDIEVLCMKRAEGRTDVFLVRKSKMPSDPFMELKEYYSEREYVDGYDLSTVSVEAVNYVKISWKNYNSSLVGIWHHPSFPEILDTMKLNSEFKFNVPQWCYSEMKDTAFIEVVTSIISSKNSTS